MHKTPVIFFEGLPGSGKSTMAHFIARQLRRANRACTWHYEVNKWHPITPFHGMDSFQHFYFSLVRTRQFQTIFNVYLEKWQQFVDQLQGVEEVVLADSGLFGTLTWMLFSFDLPEKAFRRYLAQVYKVISALDPCLIYLSQRDALTSLKRWLTRQGGEAEKNAIESKTASPYGKRHQLVGFEGLLQFWSDYQELLLATFSDFPFSKKEIENTAGDWVHSQQQVVDFLGLTFTSDPSLSQEELQRFVGLYRDLDQEEIGVVEYEGDSLYLSGLAATWQRNKLIPLTSHAFEIESLPLKVHFTPDGQGHMKRFMVSGPEQLRHSVHHVYHRVEPMIEFEKVEN
jgi:DNA polymerase III delta prime subunit